MDISTAYWYVGVELGDDNRILTFVIFQRRNSDSRVVSHQTSETRQGLSVELARADVDLEALVPSC